MVLVMLAFPLPTISPNATPQQALSFLVGLFTALFLRASLNAIGVWVLSSISLGTAVMFTSRVLQKGQTELRASLSDTVHRLLPIMAVSLITGILSVLGLIALIVPGIIIAIMFSLSLPALLIEKTGVLESLGRSRKLVGKRWLKTFGLLLVFGLISLVIAGVTSFITAPLGLWSALVNSLVQALYLPLSTISLTIYYYSNAARLAYPQPGFTWAVPGTFKYCTTCGTPLPAFAAFCSNCGARQLH